MLRNPSFYKWFFAVIAVLAIIFMIINAIYNAIYRDQWLKENEAIRAAFAQTNLATVSRVEPFSLASSYMIVFGQDADGEDMIVWVAMDDGDGHDDAELSGESGKGGNHSQNGQGVKTRSTVTDHVYGEQEKKIVIGDLVGVDISPGIRVVHAEYAENGYNENLLRLKMRETMPDVHIIKMTPGKYEEEWVWEVYYKKSAKDERTYYDYYRFSDGELLKTLTLRVK